MLEPLPAFAAWRFVGAVDGFEVVYAEPGLLRGHTSAVEDGRPYAVRYRIAFDERWRTREVRVVSDSLSGSRQVELRSDGKGRWSLDGAPEPALDGLLDVDLEASACTNTLPVHRTPMAVGETVRSPAAYVRAFDLAVVRLDQTYRRLDGERFAYTADGGFSAVLTYDRSGLVVDYPGIAARFA
ncbi:MAG TPA: putative glycolipid-binding domain-containing protein [Friedmanniella sp.]